MQCSEFGLDLELTYIYSGFELDLITFRSIYLNTISKQFCWLDSQLSLLEFDIIVASIWNTAEI